MSTAAQESAALLRAFAREPGRSVLARVETPAAAWEGGIAVDAPHPAASLLKLPLAMALEQAFAGGRGDPTALVAVADVVAAAPAAGPLRVLAPGRQVTAAEVLGLCLALSDRSCAAWILAQVGIDAVRRAAAAAGCTATSMQADPDTAAGPLVGLTSARDALALLRRAEDDSRFPLTARALRNTVHSSRIPLGAQDSDIAVAHKTGTLTGVAHDVAVLDCRGGRLFLAFLSQAQHDTLVTGYEMGQCTRGLLEAWGLSVRRARPAG